MTLMTSGASVAANGRRLTMQDAESAVSTLLRYLGYDPSTAGLADTPARVVRALAEMTEGQWLDPGEYLARTFAPDVTGGDVGGQIIGLTGVEFESVCEHHLMPFTGTASVAYLPAAGAQVVGLSKLARLVEVYAHRLTMQERLTFQIATALHEHLDTVGAACIVRSRHACLAVRGARRPGAVMVTSHLTGVFRDQPAMRAELSSLLLHGGGEHG